VLGLIAAAVVALVLTGLAFGGDGGTVLPTTTTTTAPVRAVRPTRTPVRTAPPTTAPTTTVAPTTTTPTTVADVLPPAGPTGPKEKDPKKTADGGPGPGSAPRA
jgi:carboxypeptidase N regulatory subunit